MSDMAFDAEHLRYLRARPHGTLATIAPSGAPQNKPVGFSYDEQQGTIEIAGLDMEHSAKFRNVAVNSQVAFTVQDVRTPPRAPQAFASWRSAGARSRWGWRSPRCRDSAGG